MNVSDRTTRKGLPTWIPLVLIGGVLAVIVAVALFSGGSSSDTDTNEGLFSVQPVTISGSILTSLAEGIDPMVGTVAPELEGFGLDGEPLSFVNGTPRAVLFLAHWCPHCQAEVNQITAFLSTGSFPEGVEIETISTWVTSDRDNYPPSKWLEGVSWPFPVLADDEEFSAAGAFGLAGTPMWVFIDADGKVLERTGALEPEALAVKLSLLSS